MGIDGTVLRVFTDQEGRFGNPLSVVDASQVQTADRPRLASELVYSETIFVDLLTGGSTTARAAIYTPRTEIPFAGHPCVGAAWLLRANGTPVNTLAVPAGIVQVQDDGELVAVSCRSEWAPEFALHEFDSVDELLAQDPGDYADDTAHYLWTWVDRSAGALRSRSVHGQPRRARGRSDRLRGDAHHRPPQPRPDHRPGQGFDTGNGVELRGVGVGGAGRHRRRDPL